MTLLRLDGEESLKTEANYIEATELCKEGTSFLFLTSVGGWQGSELALTSAASGVLLLPG